MQSSPTAFGALVPLLLLLVVAGFFILGVGFWIWMLIDCAVHEPAAGNEKVVWILVIILTNWVGALIYLVVRRPQRIRLHGR